MKIDSTTIAISFGAVILIPSNASLQKEINDYSSVINLSDPKMEELQGFTKATRDNKCYFIATRLRELIPQVSRDHDSKFQWLKVDNRQQLLKFWGTGYVGSYHCTPEEGVQVRMGVSFWIFPFNSTIRETIKKEFFKMGVYLRVVH